MLEKGTVGEERTILWVQRHDGVLSGPSSASSVRPPQPRVMSGLRLITGNGVFVGLGFPSLRFLSTKGTNIDIFGAFLVNNQRFEPAILMIPDSGSSSPPSEEGVVTPAYDGINQTQPRLQSDGPIIDKLQHLASFLLIRGPFAWLGWAWLGCGNFPYRPPCDPPPPPPSRLG